MTFIHNALLAAICVFGAASTVQAATEPLSQLKWKNRVLLIFADQANNENLIKQRQMLQRNPGEVADRDLIIVEIVGNEARNTDDPSIRLDGDTLRKRFLPPKAGFAVVLVGKDGGSKLERTTPIDPDLLFKTIDAMPMRQSEMR